MKSLADQKGVKVSGTPSATKRMEIKLLSERKGASFDQHYAESIGVDAHQDAVKLFQTRATSTARFMPPNDRAILKREAQGRK